MEFDGKSTGPRRVPTTGRTTAKGDRSGRKAPARRDVHVRRYYDGSANTRSLDLARDPETGRLKGVKIAPCRACGKVRAVQVAIGLCTVASCLRRRVKVNFREANRRRAQEPITLAVQDTIIDQGSEIS